MHSSHSFLIKLLAICCVAVCCVSSGLGRTKKTTHSGSKSVKSVKAASTRKTSGTTKAAKVSTSTKASKKGKATKAAKRSSAQRTPVARYRGQQTIDGDRAREIQEALIRANYLNGDPSGVWDNETRTAMARFQNDNGWQTKVVPDSRALIKLGLGPNHENVINRGAIVSDQPADQTARQLGSAVGISQR